MSKRMLYALLPAVFAFAPSLIAQAVPPNLPNRLTAQERPVFQVAAVIGTVFWFNMLQALLDEPRTLKADLAALR